MKISVLEIWGTQLITVAKNFRKPVNPSPTDLFKFDITVKRYRLRKDVSNKMKFSD
jgi:hypothetical protein